MCNFQVLSASLNSAESSDVESQTFYLGREVSIIQRLQGDKRRDLQFDASLHTSDSPQRDLDH